MTINEKKDLRPIYEEAKRRFYKVQDLDSLDKTEKKDAAFVRVGVIPDVNKEIKWNYFDGENTLFKEDFDKAETFQDGTAVVIRNNKYNVAKTNGTFVFKEWYDYVFKTNVQGKYIVEIKQDEFGINRKSAFADESGEIISDWYDQLTHSLSGSLYCVSKGERIVDRKSALYDLEDNTIVSEWYDSLMFFQWKEWLGKPIARVELENKWNFIREDGILVFGEWSVKPIEVQKDGSCQITTEDKKTYNANAKTGVILKSVN